jgi:hypothetical protein
MATPEGSSEAPGVRDTLSWAHKLTFNPDELHA